MVTSKSERLKAQLATKKWPMVLMLKDKHENEYFLLNDIDALWRAALQIVELRLKQRYYYEPKPDKLREEVPDDVIEKLPEDMRKKAKSDKGFNATITKRYERELAQWNDIQKALTEKDGVLAYQILGDRIDHEYEGFEFVRLKVP